MSEQSASILYDIPGPRARRITLISSAIAGVLVLVGVYFLVYRPLADNGEFSGEKWGPLLNPGNEVFSLVWNRLAFGARQTLIAAVLAILFSLVAGTLLGVLRIQLRALLQRRFTGLAVPAAYGLRGLSWLLNTITRICVEVFRGLPVVITIFFVSRLGPSIGFSVANPMWYLVVGLTIYNMVVIAEILRSGMTGLPGGQAEAAAALGLSSFQTTRLILLPQAFRVMLPALISQLVVVLKDTSLGVLISYEELLNVGKQITGTLSNPIQVYAVIGAMYITVNYALSKLAQYIQRRAARGMRVKVEELPQVPPSVGMGTPGGMA
ncbi:MAG: amino acid ABC transporter permease [Longispora sp.]|nr:amino acid ABC transporter permease [Longispora sp. (in: high G+C Gram-positive bacteria)]